MLALIYGTNKYALMAQILQYACSPGYTHWRLCSYQAKLSIVIKAKHGIEMLQGMRIERLFAMLTTFQQQAMFEFSDEMRTFLSRYAACMLQLTRQICPW